MPAPVFSLPVDTPRRIPKSQISLIRINSDPSLKRNYFRFEYPGPQRLKDMASSNDQTKLMNGFPASYYEEIKEKTPYDARAGVITYNIPFDGTNKLRDGYSYAIAAMNYSANPNEICTFKDLHVDENGHVQIKSPERLSLELVTIGAFERCSGNNSYICCDGTTDSDLMFATLIEHLDWWDIVYPAIYDEIHPSTWECRFNVGNYGIGQRDFTLYVVNQQFDSQQQSKTL